MVKASEVVQFLKEFHDKMEVWDVLYRDDRGKNSQALADLEIIPIERTSILKKLNPQDYSEGPLKDILYGGSEMWVFGKEVKGKEVYIKITMAFPGLSVICISFHFAEHPLLYPLK